MAASAGDSGFGVAISHGDGTAYTAFGEVLSIDLGGIDSDVIDMTHSSSPNEFREKIPGLGDAGQITVEVNYAKTETTAIYALHRVAKFYKVALPDSSTWICAGFLKTIGQAVPTDDKMTQSLTIELSGKPAWTAA